MSATSLPSYTDNAAPSVNRVPSYSREPAAHEQRLALSERARGRPAGSFVKHSKNGNVTLRLAGQEEGAVLPVYGSTSVVEGTVDVARSDAVVRVEVKIEGHLKIREIGEGGHSSIAMFQEELVLLSRPDGESPGGGGSNAPISLPLSFRLPESFVTEDGKTYPLPPTYDVKLSGFPGFTANVDYSISVLINKPSSSTRAISSKAMGLIVGTTAIATPFVYRPRTRPPSATPPPLVTDAHGFVLPPPSSSVYTSSPPYPSHPASSPSPDWILFETTLSSRQSNLQDIVCKLYLPSSRVFCLSESIPFHLSLHSSKVSLGMYLPLGPTAKILQGGREGGKKATQVRLMRQSTVDVKNLENPEKLRRDMWIVDCIGEGTINLQADAPSWIAYTGRIRASPDITISGFKAAGLSVKDFVLFTVTPPEPTKSVFGDVRLAVPVKLTTDAHIAGSGGSRNRMSVGDGTGIGRPPSDHSSEQ